VEAGIASLCAAVPSRKNPVRGSIEHGSSSPPRTFTPQGYETETTLSDGACRVPRVARGAARGVVRGALASGGVARPAAETTMTRHGASLRREDEVGRDPPRTTGELSARRSETITSDRSDVACATIAARRREPGPPARSP
jgi:hypothetical protein